MRLTTTRRFCRKGIRLSGSMLLLLSIGVLAGCGMPSPPLAPTLKLPAPVKDLGATRSGTTVRLAWTMPRRTTDNISLVGKMPVYVWRTTANRNRDLVGDFSLEPGGTGEFADVLPPELQSGSPLALYYTVELLNHTGHSAGLSNLAYSAAGAAPPAVTELSAQLASDGVQLHWEEAGIGTATAELRIHRRLLDAPPAKTTSPQVNGQEPAAITLLVTPDDAKDHGAALDASVVFGRHYQYWVERVLQTKVDGHSVEILSAPSNTVDVQTKDIFPPKAPQQLAAVATRGVVDLSWSANTEPDLAGYIVYRCETGGKPERVSPADVPLIAPTFRDTSTEPGVTYRYSVSAVDNSGNESPRSAEAEETVPK
jgi:hypothetical protein